MCADSRLVRPASVLTSVDASSLLQNLQPNADVELEAQHRRLQGGHQRWWLGGPVSCLRMQQPFQLIPCTPGAPSQPLDGLLSTLSLPLGHQPPDR